MAMLNQRLVGRTFADCFGKRATVVESMAGLACGKVCVEGSDGRRSAENLRYVLSNLDDPDPDLVLAADLLARADALKKRQPPWRGPSPRKGSATLPLPPRWPCIPRWALLSPPPLPGGLRPPIKKNRRFRQERGPRTASMRPDSLPA